MWYVNEQVCEMLNICYKSFILTMWYVNNDLARSSIVIVNSFILTMWYVNLYKDSRNCDDYVKVLY